jgi:hypothetical protein
VEGVSRTRTAHLEGFPVKADELLLWLSARKQGSWEQFKGAVEALHAPDDESPQEADVDAEEERGREALPVYQHLRLNLQRLGHAEFFAQGCENGWRIAPPVLATREHEGGWIGILSGARSRRLLARLHDAVAGRAALQTEEQEGAPLVQSVTAEDQSILASVAAEVGLYVQADAPLAILYSLPSVCDRSVRHAEQLPLGSDWRVDRFSPENLGWSESSREEAQEAHEGLFRFRYIYQWRYFLCFRGVAYETPGQIGKFTLLRRLRQRVLSYDREMLSLTLPAACRPPVLMERALILCTGKLPSFDGRMKTLTYAGIPPLAAQIAARVLCQEN